MRSQAGAFFQARMQERRSTMRRASLPSLTLKGGVMKRTVVHVVVGVFVCAAALATDASAQHRGGAMGRAATRAAAPRAGVAPVDRGRYPDTVRIAPRIVTAYPYRPYYRPYYYPYRPGYSVGLYSGYTSYGYYPVPYDYPYNYTYFDSYGPYYGSSRYSYVPPPAYVRASPGYAYGGLKIQGAPSDAQVFVDGYYSGIVNDFDGAFQHMNLQAGAHRVELRVPGMEPVTFDVKVAPGQTITYHAGIR